MKKLHIIDAGGLVVEYSTGPVQTAGRLNHTLSDMARTFFQEKGWEVSITYIKDDYVLSEETRKFKEADLVIFQFPLWWFSAPAKLKNYIDSVYEWKQLWLSDGRHHENPDRNYGTGGLLKGKPYFLSITCTAPRYAFEAPDDFMNGDKDANQLLSWLDASNRFLGMKKIHKNFICYDVMKNPTVDKYFADFKVNLAEIYEKLEGK